MEVKKQSLVHVVRSEEYMILQKRVEELNVQLAEIREEKEQLQQGKVCLTVVHLAYFCLSVRCCVVCIIYNSISEPFSMNITLCHRVKLHVPLFNGHIIFILNFVIVLHK
jgi:hypothetical protein